MNDNVKKIPMLEKFAAQSLVYVDTGLDDGKELVFSKEKFAELIVYDVLSDLTNDDSLGAARIESIRRLAERYGVAR